MAKVSQIKSDYLKFLGTAGARFVMLNQLRSSGGIWLDCAGTKVLIDPGPGSIVRCAKSRPRLNPGQLDAIILTHRHLDHANDINVMIEAMTEGGFKKRGIVFCPPDAINEDPIILKHALAFPKEVCLIQENQEYRVNDFVFTTSMRHIHPCQTYGLKFSINNTSIGLISDTGYFDQLVEFYKTDILIIAVVLLEKRPGIAHLCLDEAASIIKAVSPRKAILTHFGMSMLKARPHIKAAELSDQLGIEVVAATDGMLISLGLNPA